MVSGRKSAPAGRCCPKKHRRTNRIQRLKNEVVAERIGRALKSSEGSSTSGRQKREGHRRRRCEAGRPRRIRVAAGPGLPARCVHASLAANRRASPTAVPLKGAKAASFPPLDPRRRGACWAVRDPGRRRPGAGSGPCRPGDHPLRDGAGRAFLRLKKPWPAVAPTPPGKMPGHSRVVPCSSSPTNVPSRRGKSTSICLSGRRRRVNPRREWRLGKDFFSPAAG
jgi:hypothetical protein